MLISLNWIREYCPFETSEAPLEIGTRFMLHAAEVEAAVDRGAGLDGILVARVLSVEPHPDADRLAVACVDAGAGPVDVVCGAPNVRADLYVPYAPAGAVVQGHEIKVAKVRGVLSQGMLCSQKELGISDDGAGLWELPSPAQSGTPLLEAFPELRDVVLEIDNKSLTHRPDLWGHYGLAREFSTIYRVPLSELDIDEKLASGAGQASIEVRIVGDGVGGRDGLCPRYCGLQIDGVKIAPSPTWLQHRLLSVGSRPINNVVDVTNYILFELGQPLHAFDTSLVEGGEIRVRCAASGETLKLLDDTTIELREDDLVIADSERAVALAGVMGGEGTEIEATTTSIFLECANFAPAGIRRTSTRVGKRTDSALRFEKSLDPKMARDGVLRAAKLIVDMCPGATVVGSLQDVGYEPAETIEIQTCAKFLAGRLGAKLKSKDVRETLSWLGFEIDGTDRGDWRVTVPSWRATKDVSIQEDLVEEVGRIYGYDRIVPCSPLWTVIPPQGNPMRALERRVKAFLTQHVGMSEIFTYSMVGETHCQKFGMEPDAHLKLQNPLSADMDRLRREIVPIHLEKAKENQRYAQRFGFFALGRVYRKDADRLRSPELPQERQRLVGVSSYEETRPENFYQLRRGVLDLLERSGFRDATVLAFSDGDHLQSWVHPAVGGKIMVRGNERGRLYRVHPVTMRWLKLKGEVIAFDLDFESLFEDGCEARSQYLPPLRYPTVPFDVAVVAGERVPVGEIQQVIGEAATEALLSLEVLSVYSDLADGKKSVAFHLVFGSPDRTLSGEEVTALQQRVIGALEDRGFPLR